MPMMMPPVMPLFDRPAIPVGPRAMPAPAPPPSSPSAEDRYASRALGHFYSFSAYVAHPVGSPVKYHVYRIHWIHLDWRLCVGRRPSTPPRPAERERTPPD